MSKKNISLSLVCILLFTFLSVSTVNANENSLSPYRAVLKKMNAQLGTDYTFPTAEQMKDNGECYTDLIEFYTTMSIKEFENYIITSYKNDINNNKTKTNNIINNETEISPQAYTKT